MQQVQRRAAEIVGEVLAGRSLDAILVVARDRQPQLTDSEKGALQDICFGTLRTLGTIDRQLEALLAKPLSDEALRNLLRVAVYQLRSTRAPTHAIVDQAVKAAVAMKMVAARGLVNAVLRNFIRRRDELEKHAAETESGRYSFPQWWIDRTREQYPEDWKKILESANERPPMTLRVNRRRCTREEYLRQLESAGMSAVPVGGEGLLLARPAPVGRLPEFATGAASVQDAGAQLAAHFLDVQNGMRVLDACAAPGGKATHILECADVDLTALDSSKDRLGRIEDNLTRLGLVAKVLVGDASRPDEWWDGRPFDRVLADVPCSGSGVVRRHPDIRWLRQPADPRRFAVQQSAILDGLWRVLARGGKLLYATCSIFHEENWRQIQGFVQRHADARRLAIDGCDGLSIHSSGQILPDDRHDGFFYALLEKA